MVKPAGPAFWVHTYSHIYDKCIETAQSELTGSVSDFIQSDISLSKDKCCNMELLPTGHEIFILPEHTKYNTIYQFSSYKAKLAQGYTCDYAQISR